MDCIKVTFRKEGIRGLYKGVASPTLTMGVMNAILFCSYNGVLNLISDKKEPSLYEIYIAGYISGGTTCIINSPSELIKCLAQVNLNNKGYLREEWDICKQLFRRGGLFQEGLGRGIAMTFVRDSFSYGLYFVIYEYIARMGNKSKFSIFMAGGFAGALAWASIYPLDCFKSRWQTCDPKIHTTWVGCLQRQIEVDGKWFWRKGFWATMARAWPQNAVLFFTYELSQKYLFGETPNEEQHQHVQ